MRGWNYNHHGWKYGRQPYAWVWLLIAGGVFLLLLRSGWSWWWLFMFWWVLPAVFGGWGWRHPDHRSQSCNPDAAEKAKRRQDEFATEKPKREDVYIYREDGEVIEVTDAPEKPVTFV
jgi:hypothetical protein